MWILGAYKFIAKGKSRTEMSVTMTRKAAQIGCAFPYGGRSCAEVSLCIISSSRQPFEEGMLLSAFYIYGTQGLQGIKLYPPVSLRQWEWEWECHRRSWPWDLTILTIKLCCLRLCIPKGGAPRSLHSVSFPRGLKTKVFMWCFMGAPGLLGVRIFVCRGLECVSRNTSVCR